MLHKFKSIPEMIESEPKLEGVRKIAKEFDVIKDFYKIFPEFKSVVRPVKVSKEILFLSVHNSVMRSEININKNLFLEKINEYFHSTIVKQIKFVL